ncbi:MAG TPA: STAS domain-containing protein [Gammaproteobacteria bacterium]
MNGSSLDITEVHSGQTCVLALSGRIDSTNADQFTACVNRLFAAGEKDLVVDFKEVLYLTSAAFRVLLVATDEAERSAARFALCSVAGQVRELFEMGGLLDLFTVHASRDEALGHTP